MTRTKNVNCTRITRIKIGYEMRSKKFFWLAMYGLWYIHAVWTNTSKSMVGIALRWYGSHMNGKHPADDLNFEELCFTTLFKWQIKYPWSNMGAKKLLENGQEIWMTFLIWMDLHTQRIEWCSNPKVLQCFGWCSDSGGSEVEIDVTLTPRSWWDSCVCISLPLIVYHAWLECTGFPWKIHFYDLRLNKGNIA